MLCSNNVAMSTSPVYASYVHTRERVTYFVGYVYLRDSQLNSLLLFNNVLLYLIIAKISMIELKI